MEIDLEHIRAALQRDAAWVVFSNVLLQQLGMPVPVVPTLVAGSVAAKPEDVAMMLFAAVTASVSADCLWYAFGILPARYSVTGCCLVGADFRSISRSA
jgi:membrane protein DedA with SNARE-associated domain